MTDFTLADIERVLETGSSIIVETSGSTGIPKRVRVSAAALRASALATAERIGEGQWVLALPTSYIAGIQVLVRSVLAGTQPIALPPGPFRTPWFVAAAGQLTSPGYVSLVPAQLRSLLGDAPARAALANFTAVLVGGQRVAPELVDACADAGINLIRTYGSTETSGGCVYGGFPLEGVALRIENGEVQVSGATLADGYVDPDGKLLESPAFIDDGGTRWYRTGDAGVLSPDGELTISGRTDRVFISGGVNVSLDRLESVLHTVPGLEHAAAVAIPSEHWGEVPVVTVPVGIRSLAEVLAALGIDARAGASDDDLYRDAELRLLALARDIAVSHIGPAAKPFHVFLTEALPMTSSGKTDYAELSRRYSSP